jgi:hypothetical protein
MMNEDIEEKQKPKEETRVWSGNTCSSYNDIEYTIYESVSCIRLICREFLWISRPLQRGYAREGKIKLFLYR